VEVAREAAQVQDKQARQTNYAQTFITRLKEVLKLYEQFEFS
jgi:hypothetical protein